MPYSVLPSQLDFSQTMTNRSLITGKLPFTIQYMIENALLHSILDSIFKKIERPWWGPQNNNRFNILCRLLEIRKWGSLQKDKVKHRWMGRLVMGKWKDKNTRSIYCHKHAKAKPLINKTRYKRLSLGNVHTCNGILETTHKP